MNSIFLEKTVKVTSLTVVVILAIPAIVTLAAIVLTQWGINHIIDSMRQRGWIS